MRTVFDESLDELHRDLLRLGIKVNEAIAKATRAFVELDMEMAETVIKEDKDINDTEREIEEKSHQIIAVQQPNASDLRRIIAVMRATNNLERMADHAQNVAEATINIKGNKQKPELEEIIVDMAENVLEMSVGIVDAFVDFDVKKAQEIAEHDHKVDKLYNELRYSAVTAVQEDRHTVEAASDYSFIGMDLERIGDYVTNIAEGIVYLDSGDIVDLNH